MLLRLGALDRSRRHRDAHFAGSCGVRTTFAHVKTIERHFGCPVVCGTPRNAIIFRATDANRPFVTRNAELLGILAPQFDEELKEENGDENFIEHVRIAIQQRLTGRRPTIEDGADVLHISSRTLQRRLQDEGSSFQRVLEEARHQLARHYLNNSVLELNEAAYLLGYEDGNSFVRAFRTWEGVPPARWREQQRARAASQPEPIQFVRRNNAKAETWKKQLRSLGHRARLHGNELRLWSGCGQKGDDLSDSVCRRTWRNVLRHRRSLRSFHQRRTRGRSAGSTSGPGGDGHQIRVQT